MMNGGMIKSGEVENVEKWRKIWSSARYGRTLFKTALRC